MKTWLYYIAALFLLQMQLASCADDQLVDNPANGQTGLSLVLSIPTDNGTTRGLIYGPDEAAHSEYETAIKDIYALAFNADGTCIEKFDNSLSNAGTFIATINKTEAVNTEITVLILANLQEQENGSDLISIVNSAEGRDKSNILQDLEYGFSSAWDVSRRSIPMWGEITIATQEGKIVSGDVKLYRAVSKINVTVNKGQGVKAEDQTDIFKLKSVRVYYVRTGGLAGSLHAPQPNSEGSPTIIAPSIPANVSYMPRYKDGGPNGIVFNTDADYSIENKIYVPESDNTGEEPMCLVVGGYYKGSAAETYYRVDFKEKNTGSTYYNAIRNHIYNFDITGVTRPGTDEPDEALDHVVVGMEVTITAWTTEFMRGIGGQYTLKVDAGGVLMAANNQSGNRINVTTTHNNGWDIENGSQAGNWYTVAKTADGNGVLITPHENKGGQRRGSFVITSGNLRKVIMVRQKGKGTANCYVVSDDGTHIWQDLPVTVKGNGEDGMISDGKPLADQEPNIAPADVKIIWETAAGLVKLETENGKTKISEDGIVRYQIDLSKRNSNIAGSNQPNLKGGNALIGAFDANGVLLWSWHLWICPDMDNNGNGIVDAGEIASHLELWSTGYTFMDRNLGALSPKPGLASLGLLYQWGRKDPFIGAGAIAENASRMTTSNLNGFPWGSRASMSVEDAKKAPTTLSGSALTGTDYALLWGTDKGFDSNGERDAGNKTIYDPCPVGYRVPPVGSVVFKSGRSSSENTNWDKNNVYWPNNVNNKSPNYINPSNTDSYGFWVSLGTGNGGAKPTGVPTYYYRYWGEYYGQKNNAESISGATWLPISGVYDGNMNKFAHIDNQYSITVNSIVWTNSSINANGTTRPGALFLHGAEDTSKPNSSSGNGRHIHRLIESSNNLYAKPSYAGSVRCIKDEKSSIQNAIKVPESITLGNYAGATITATLVSITETWEVIDPGASWFTMTPDEGGTGSAQTITFTAAERNTGGARSAVLVIRFSDGTEKSITVTQQRG